MSNRKRGARPMSDDFDPTDLNESAKPAVDPDEAAAELAAAEAEAAEEAKPKKPAKVQTDSEPEVVPDPVPEPEPAPEPDPEPIEPVAEESAASVDAWELARVPAQSRVPGADPLNTVPLQSRINTDGSEIAR